MSNTPQTPPKLIAPQFEVQWLPCNSGEIFSYIFLASSSTFLFDSKITEFLVTDGGTLRDCQENLNDISIADCDMVSLTEIPSTFLLHSIAAERCQDKFWLFLNKLSPKLSTVVPQTLVHVTSETPVCRIHDRSVNWIPL